MIMPMMMIRTGVSPAKTQSFRAGLWFCGALLLFGIAGFSPARAESEKETLTKEFYSKGIEYYRAQDIPQHYDEAFVWISKAAEYDHPRAQAILADMYHNGLGTQINEQKSLELTKAAAEQGDTFGQFLLGKALYLGLGAKQDRDNGTKILSHVFNALEEEANSGDVHAQSSLAWIYYHLSDANNDYQKAHFWYEKAAVQGYAVAQNALGLLFERGDGVRENSQAKMVWYRRAASQGAPIGQYNLAMALGEQRDFDGQFTWVRRSADLHYAEAQYFLGWIYEVGEGGTRDLHEALLWYRKAADQDHVLAQYKLGEFYHYGSGVSQDYEEARKWYEMAAKNGDADAMANLGHFFEKGFGVEKDYATARDWYTQGADQHHSPSQARLGFLYLYGYGVKKDLGKAREWLERAAGGGNESAYYGIGLIHEEKGRYSQAIRWYLLSAIKGYGFGFKRAVFLMVLYPVISMRA